MGAGFSSYQILYHHQNRITLPFAYSPPPPTRKDNRNDTRVEILASYNGLLLLGIGQKDHFLWNPSTRSYKRISCNFYHQIDSFRMYGLGYESSSNAYKVIRIVRVVVNWGVAPNTHHNFPSYDSTTVKVHNSRTNFWRSITDFPYKTFVDQQGLLVNGAPHWIVTRAESEEYVIIYFDLVEEKFKELGKPNWLVSDSAFCLGVFNGLLTLLRNANDEVWVMKEHGVKDSWTKLITKDKSMLYESNYDVRIRPFQERFAFQRVEYVESLVSPHIERE